MEVVNAVVLSLTLIILVWQTILQKRVQRAELLLRFRDLFNSKEKKEIHMKLRPAGEWASVIAVPNAIEEWVEIDDYLGCFELLQLYLDNKIIKKSDITSFYEYRLKNILRSEVITEKIKKERQSWKNLIKLSMIITGKKI